MANSSLDELLIASAIRLVKTSGAVTVTQP